MKLQQIDIDRIKPNPFQPRMEFKKEELQELADNINKHGMIEPIVATPKGINFMIVAGERRWRANQLAKKSKMYVIVKNYEKDSDIKRDSLIENEMREDLKNEEFKAFVFSLAKSLGKPYFDKGWINADKLTEYILGASTHSSPFRRRISQILSVQRQASPTVKKLIKEEKIDLDTAARIAKVQDKQTQNELADLAKHKSTTEIRQQVARHNFEQKAKKVKEEIKKETDEEKIRKSEMGLISKFCNKINSWNDSINYLSDNIKTNRRVFAKFSHESKMDMLGSLKPLRRDLEKALHLTTKLMEEMAK